MVGRPIYQEEIIFPVKQSLIGREKKINDWWNGFFDICMYRTPDRHKTD